MPRIRLLVSVQGDRGVVGDVGDELDVDNDTARIWADGRRAERVLTRSDPAETAVRRPSANASANPSAPRRAARARGSRQKG